MYQVILSDPAWWYNSRKTGGERKDKTKFGGGAQKHYELIPDPKMRELHERIGLIADKNCAMFMWATMPRLDFALECMALAGFKYRTTAFVWHKVNKNKNSLFYGPGFYTASNTEVVLLGIKGRMSPAQKMMPSVIFTRRGAHSQKPALYKRIDLLYPDCKKIELFARRAVPNWECWGIEAPGGVILQELEMG